MNVLVEPMKKETACTFMDVRNISTPLKNNTEISDNDYEAMILYINRDYENLGVFGYDARIVDEGKVWDRGFHEKLEHSGIKLELRDSPNKEVKQGFIDVAMSNDILLDKVPAIDPDRVIIMSGDGDLIDTVRRLIKMGYKVTVCAFKDCMKNDHVTEGADIVYLDSVPVLKMPLSALTPVATPSKAEAMA